MTLPGNDSLHVLDQQSYLRTLRLRAAITIGTIAIIVLIGTVIIQVLLSTQTNSNSLISSVDEGLLQAQQIGIQLVVYSQVENLSDEERNTAAANLARAFGEWKTCCINDIESYLDSRNDPVGTDARERFQQVISRIECLIADAQSSALPAGCDAAPPASRVLLDVTLMNNTMRNLAADEQAEFDAGINNIRNVSLIAMIATEVLLLGMSLFILRPALIRVERSFSFIVDTRNRLSTSETRFRHMAETIDEAFWLTTTDENTILYVNPAYEMITGLSTFSLMQEPKSWRQIIHTDDRARVTEVIQSQRDFQIEYRIMRSDGVLRWVWHRLRHIDQTNRGIPMIVSVVMDITERKRFETEMQRATETAEAASSAKTAFLANMSHELRTPLNAILGFAQLLRDDNKLSGTSRDNLDIIINSGEHLLALINDVLDMSRIEAGKVVLEEEQVELYDVLDYVDNMFAVTAQNKGLTFQIDRATDLPTRIIVDPKKLRQILINLVGNAVKFTEEGGVLVRVRWDNNDENTILLSIAVEDTGPGIGQDEIKTLFDAFKQTRSGYRKQEGTGLGLPISQTFAEVMGGHIDVESQVGAGTTFRLVLPTKVVATEADVTAEPPRRVTGVESGQPAYRILVVDDNENSRLLMQRLLEPLNFIVRAGVDGHEAVQIAAMWSPHLIFMDMRMPNMDGYEATRRIRTAQHSAEVRPVVVGLTASVFDTEEADVLTAGCDVVMRKPFRKEQMFALLETWLDVAFTYADDKLISPTREVALTAESLQSMPADWRHELLNAAEEADSNQVRESIEAIADHHGPLADALASLADNFEFDRLVMLLRNPSTSMD